MTKELSEIQVKFIGKWARERRKKVFPGTLEMKELDRVIEKMES